MWWKPSFVACVVLEWLICFTLQVQLEPTSQWALLRRDAFGQSKYTGMLQATKDIFREEGLPVLVIYEVVSVDFVFISFYEEEKQFIFLTSSCLVNMVFSLLCPDSYFLHYLLILYIWIPWKIKSFQITNMCLFMAGDYLSIGGRDWDLTA